MTRDDDYKNTLPNETNDHPDSGMPRQLRTQVDDERPLGSNEAAAAGITQTVYGETENEQDRADVRVAQPDEHV